MIILFLDLLLVVGSAIAVHKTSVFERHFCLILCLFISSVWVGLADATEFARWPHLDFVLWEPARPMVTRSLIAFGVWYSAISRNRTDNGNIFRCIEGKQ
jgi:hypothetical protein